jgi:hypothetical protein
VSSARRPIAASDPEPLPLSPRDRLLALANRLLRLLPNPSEARSLALEIVRELDPIVEPAEDAG